MAGLRRADSEYQDLALVDDDARVLAAVEEMTLAHELPTGPLSHPESGLTALAVVNAMAAEEAVELVAQRREGVEQVRALAHADALVIDGNHDGFLR